MSKFDDIMGRMTPYQERRAHITVELHFEFLEHMHANFCVGMSGGMLNEYHSEIRSDYNDAYFHRLQSDNIITNMDFDNNYFHYRFINKKKI